MDVEVELLIGHTIEFCSCGYRKRIVARRMAPSAKAPEPRGGTIAKVLALLPKGRESGVTAREIAEESGIEMPRVLSALNNLRIAGHIRNARTKNPEGFGRRVLALWWKVA